MSAGHTPGLEEIWLEPACAAERCWCQQPLDDCDECDEKAVRYVRARPVTDAAPDLLAALTEILGPLNICSDNRHVRDDECVLIDITMGELRKARAAIARATGGQS